MVVIDLDGFTCLKARGDGGDEGEPVVLVLVLVDDVGAGVILAISRNSDIAK